MSAFDYGRSRETADRLIARFGQPGAIRRRAPSGPYASDGAGAPTEHPCSLVVTDYSLRERDASSIEANDRKVLVAAGTLDIEPQEDDALLSGAAEFAIVNVKAVAPGGTVVLYEIQARS